MQYSKRPIYRPAPWSRWFAWRPVSLPVWYGTKTYRIVWLQWVLRRRNRKGAWQYRSSKPVERPTWVDAYLQKGPTVVPFRPRFMASSLQPQNEQQKPDDTGQEKAEKKA